jgi:predicted glycosyltransferase
MRIFIDIGHPAHVHYFKNFIKIMESKGHTIFVSARERSIIFLLLNEYKIVFYNRGKGRDSIIGKLIYMIVADFKLLSKAIKFKPDLFISFASPYAAQTSWLMRRPHIVIDDTEHARFGHFFYKPFSKVFLNPSCFQKDFGKKQVRFNSYSELFYLHPNYLSEYSGVWKILGITENDKFALLRFVSWKANHDIGHSGLDLNTKMKLVTLLEENDYKVFISAESENAEPIFEKYLVKFNPALIHFVLKKADILITEGATMASECAMLGTPSIYINSLDAGTLREQEDRYQLVHGFRTSVGVIEKVFEIIKTHGLNNIYQLRQEKMLSEKIDATAFLVWFIEKYPESVSILKENLDYQIRFV